MDERLFRPVQTVGKRKRWHAASTLGLKVICETNEADAGGLCIDVSLLGEGEMSWERSSLCLVVRAKIRGSHDRGLNS